VTRRRGRRRKKLLDDLGDRRGYSHLKEDFPSPGLRCYSIVHIIVHCISCHVSFVKVFNDIIVQVWEAMTYYKLSSGGSEEFLFSVY
jgi:hypothetical protein